MWTAVFLAAHRYIISVNALILTNTDWEKYRKQDRYDRYHSQDYQKKFQR
jgi:hypothetical protein